MKCPSDPTRVVLPYHWGRVTRPAGQVHGRRRAAPGPGGNTVSPTDKSLRLPDALILKFEGAVVVELDEYFDQIKILSLLRLVSQD